MWYCLFFSSTIFFNPFNTQKQGRKEAKLCCQRMRSSQKDRPEFGTMVSLRILAGLILLDRTQSPVAHRGRQLKESFRL